MLVGTGAGRGQDAGSEDVTDIADVTRHCMFAWQV